MSDDEIDDGYEIVEDVSTDLSLENSFNSTIDSVNNSYNSYYNNEKTTKPFLTKFEKAKVLGIRSEMIANGAIALINVPEHVTDTYNIAKMEFEQKKIPLIIRRHLPNGNIELWRLNDLVSL